MELFVARSRGVLQTAMIELVAQSCPTRAATSSTAALFFRGWREWGGMRTQTLCRSAERERGSAQQGDAGDGGACGDGGGDAV